MPPQEEKEAAGPEKSNTIQYGIPPYYGYGDNVAGTEYNCFISSYAMILSGLGFENASPTDVIRANNNSTGAIQNHDALCGAFGAKTQKIEITGNATTKEATIKAAVMANPQGILIDKASVINAEGYSVSHMSVAYYDPATDSIRINDPYYITHKGVSTKGTTIENSTYGSWDAIVYYRTVEPM